MRIVAVFLFFTSLVIEQGCAATPDGLRFDTDGRPSAEVLINGEGPFIFAIDTAATASSVSAPVLNKLGVEPDPDHKAMVHGAGGVAAVPLYRIESMTVGGVTRDGLYVMTSPEGHQDHAHEGLVGADVFRDGHMEFDFTGRRFVLDADEPLYAEDAYERLPADVKFGSLALVNIDINGVETTALVDTGARETIANSDLLAAMGRSVNDAGMIRAEETLGATAAAVEIYRGFSGDINIGKLMISDAPVAISDLHVFDQLGVADRPAVILGMDVMSRLGGLAIDYSEKIAGFRGR